MNGTLDEKRLPASIGGLVDFAFAAVAERAPLYLLLSLAVFAAGALVEFAVPAAKLGTTQADAKLFIFQEESVFVDSFVIAAVAIGVGMRAAGQTSAPRAIAALATARWLAVIVVSLIAQCVAIVTLDFSALSRLPDPPLLALLTAPPVWILWTVLGLAGPIAALSTEQTSRAIFTSIGRAVSLALQRANLTRLALLTFITILPTLMQSIAFDQLVEHHVARAVFWADVPIDALTVVAISALQTTYVLDFARRAGRLDEPRR